MTTKRLVIIPAAGLATRMMPMSASMSKAMIPVAGRPILSHILESIKEYADHIIVVHGQHTDIPNFLHKKDYETVSFCPQDSQYNGPLGAIYSGLEYFDNHNRYNNEEYNLTIWLGDTLLDSDRHISDLFNAPQNNKSLYAVANVSDWSRWCLVKPDKDKIIEFIDKPKDNPNTDLALVGVYNLNYSIDDIIDIAYNCVSIGDEEISDLLSGFGGYPNSRQLQNVTSSWVDCGDLPSLYTANSRMISNNARGHNSITIKDGIVYKKSSNHEAESNWYEEIAAQPIQIKSLAPQYYGTVNKDTYAIELCSGQTLQELVLYNNIHRKDVWENILNPILDKIHIMHSSKQKNILLYPDDIEKNRHMFNTNIFNRFDEIHRGRREIILDKVEYAILSRFLIESSESVAKNFTINSEVIHGDLHFGNIIFDASTNKVKLIDPRGTWGLNNNTTEGNAIYDFAKFYQSIIGQYCHISTDEYIVSPNESDIYTMLEEITDANLLKHYSAEYINLVKRYSILLLASAIPCHKDNPKRQHIMKNKALDLIKSGNYE